VRFKLDENLPVECAALLRTQGHEASTVREQGHSGADDAFLFAECLREDRVLITLDLDFSNVLSYPLDDSPGRVVIRLTNQDKGSVSSAIERMIALISSESLSNRLWVIEEARIRIRGNR
jgi:predicted nuclease of predicted toxin-antitoxin system